MKTSLLIILFFAASLIGCAQSTSAEKVKETSNLKREEKTMRIRIKDVEPKVYEIMESFDQFIKNSELSQTHQELIKIKASQLNGCAYCLNRHSLDALKAGESESRIYMLPLWDKVPMFYSEEEQVILKMTEEITFIQNGLSDETYNHAIKLFTKKQVAQIITAIIVINAWNRIGVATEMEGECQL